jgi:hypothetical protein
VFTIVLVYLLTPVFFTELPSNRLQILAFYVVFCNPNFMEAVLCSFLASNRSSKCRWFVTGSKWKNWFWDWKTLTHIIKNKLCECWYHESIDFKHHHYVEPINKNDLASFVKKNGVSEIVIVLRRQLGLPLNCTSNWFRCWNWKADWEYTQVYESKTHRIPVQYIERDFYRFFHLAGTII